MKTTVKLVLAAAVLILLGWLAVRWSVQSAGEPRDLSAQPEPELHADALAPEAPAPSEPRVALDAEVPATVPEPAAPAPDEAASEPELPRMRLRVLDEQTGETVPFLALTVHAPGGTSELTVSDSQGLASFTPREGPLSIEVRDEGTPQDLVQSQRPPEHLKGERIVLDSTGVSPQDVQVPVGPTWRLQLTGPPDVDPTFFRATFASADPRQAVDKVHAIPHADDLPWEGFGEPGERFGGPWVRFGPLARLVSGGPPWRVTLVSEDGLWAGHADVDANAGVQPAALAIAVEPRARLGGRVVDAQAKPVANNWVQLWPPGGSFDDPAKRPSLALTDAEGNYRFHGLVPGPYTLRTELKGHDDFAAEVRVMALEGSTFDVSLVTPAGARSGRVAGRVRSQSGAYEGALKASLSLKDPPTLETAKVTWEDTAEGKLGRFVFEGVTEDGPKVTLFGPDLFAIDPPSLLAAPFAAGEIEFLVLDGGPAVEIAFALQPKDGAARVQRFELFVQTNLETAPRRTTVRTEDGLARVRGLSPGARYTWRLRADGFAPLWGEGSAPAADATEVLEPRTGFGVELVVNDAAGKPLADAHVQFDGMEVATTDADGVAHAYADEAPQKIQVVWKDWVPSPKSAVKPDGTWRAFQDRLGVVLQARE